MLAGLTVTSYYTARVSAPASRRRRRAGGAGPDGTAGPRTTGDTIRAYIALTKPRIIELLLVTTVPAMVLATRDLPGATAGVDWPDWIALVFWTMVGGTLAAGSANAINCYLDRDIDLLMTRTRRRPLPAHEVEPERAVVFGLVLGVLSFVVMAYFVNLLAAFLTLLAIAFYVIVYTILLKRSTPQNIVIGGAAGALPPVIGWAAVTGNVGIPALSCSSRLVFYWTPPHFWALSLRIRKDYAAAGVPMLPVVKGIPETTRQIALYTILMVAISLVLWAVARMGVIYLVAAVVLGAIFLWQAYGLWRRGASEEASTAGAIRLYKYSISYLSLLFLAVAIDALVLIPSESSRRLGADVRRATETTPGNPRRCDASTCTAAIAVSLPQDATIRRSAAGLPVGSSLAGQKSLPFGRSISRRSGRLWSVDGPTRALREPQVGRRSGDSGLAASTQVGEQRFGGERPAQEVSSRSAGGRDAPGTNKASATNRTSPGRLRTTAPRTSTSRARTAAAMIADSA